MHDAGSETAGGLDDVQAHPAAAEDGDLVPGADSSGFFRRAESGEHRASEQRRLVERHLRIDPDDGVARENDLFREAADAEKLRDRSIAEPNAIHRSRGRVVGELAEMELSAPAVAALATSRRPRSDDVVAADDPRRRPRPASSTTPDASWPSTTGVGHAKNSFSTEISL